MRSRETKQLSTHSLSEQFVDTQITFIHRLLTLLQELQTENNPLTIISAMAEVASITNTNLSKLVALLNKNPHISLQELAELIGSQQQERENLLHQFEMRLRLPSILSEYFPWDTFSAQLEIFAVEEESRQGLHNIVRNIFLRAKNESNPDLRLLVKNEIDESYSVNPLLMFLIHQATDEKMLVGSLKEQGFILPRESGLTIGKKTFSILKRTLNYFLEKSNE